MDGMVFRGNLAKQFPFSRRTEKEKETEAKEKKMIEPKQKTCVFSQMRM